MAGSWILLLIVPIIGRAKYISRFITNSELVLDPEVKIGKAFLTVLKTVLVGATNAAGWPGSDRVRLSPHTSFGGCHATAPSSVSPNGRD